jgi:hypothetical protein
VAKKAQAVTPESLKDFRNFLFLCWKHLQLPAPTQLQYRMASFMQHGPDRIMVQAFRGASKSWVCSAFAIWWLYHNPNDNVVVVSATKDRSDAFTTFCLRLINEAPFLQHMKPRDGQRQSMVGFDIGTQTVASHSQSLVSTGIGGQITGKRANLIIADDVEIPNNSETPMLREKLAQRVTEFEALMKPDTPGKVIYLGTPQTEDTIYKGLADRGYRIRIWPIIYPDQTMVAVYGEALCPDLLRDLRADSKLAGASIEPTRFTDEWIEKTRERIGRANFALQYLLDPRLADEDLYPLRLRDLMVYDLQGDTVPERLIWSSGADQQVKDVPMIGLRGDRWSRAVVLPETPHGSYEGTIMSIDPSGRGKDETGIAIVSSKFGLLFVREVTSVDGYDDQSLTQIATLAKRYKVTKVIVEANFGDGMYTQLLMPVLRREGYPVQVEEVKHSTQKEKRIIDTLEPLMSTHRLVVDHGLIERDYRSTARRPADEQNRYRLFYQLTRLTKEKGCLASDDRADALAIACAAWTQAVARDNERAAKDSAAKRFDNMIQDFVWSVKKGQARRPRPTMVSKHYG